MIKLVIEISDNYEEMAIGIGSTTEVLTRESAVQIIQAVVDEIQVKIDKKLLKFQLEVIK